MPEWPRRFRRFLLAAGLVCLLAGTAAPAAETCGQACLEARLAELRGKVVLVDFWASWCPQCRWEIPELSRLQKELGPLGFQVLGVSLDARPEPLERFLRKNPVPYPVVRGTAEVKSSYRVVALPTTVLINRRGRVVSRREGFVEGEVLEAEIRRWLGPKRPASGP